MEQLQSGVQKKNVAIKGLVENWEPKVGPKRLQPIITNSSGSLVIFINQKAKENCHNVVILNSTKSEINKSSIFFDIVLPSKTLNCHSHLISSCNPYIITD
jgi:hypothetical protein